MNKAELVEKVAKDAEITKAKAELTVKSFLDGVTEALKTGDKVTFVGFGSFSVSDRKAQVGRNPQTGQEIKIAARKAVGVFGGKTIEGCYPRSGKKREKEEIRN
jgi:nucleoid DNA-binding protein